MRGHVLLPRISLYLDYSADPPARPAAADEQRADQAPSGGRRVSEEPGAWKGQPDPRGSGAGRRLWLAQGKTDTRSEGSRAENRWTKSGATTSRIQPAMWDWWMSRS
jgi:hypothetical protein